MSQTNDAEKSSSVLKRALAAIDQLQRELDAARHARTEPIAVVSVGCRFPGGVVDTDSYWRLLVGGVDAIQEIPPERWDVDAFFDPEAGRPGKMNTRWGGFLDDIDQFDPAFFGISAREAETMDPNQRLVLEVTWEALENAGYARLAGTRTGVFIGVIANDYGMHQHANVDEISPYAVTGNAPSVISGRIAYLLDLRGPAVTLDTACSSSLTAIYLACQSLRAGDCDLALAGGVNVILTPAHTIALSQFGMMSPDGRCHTFDAEANGFVRGEGCGIVLLKRLSDALADGDDVLAVIRGGAINQDGRSTGLTAPNVLSQRAVLRAALQASGVEAGQVSYIEAHGTGTKLGDPIEAEALAEVYPAAAGEEWYLGSVKTNFGHLEAASGVAGFIKVVLGLRNQVIPPNLHFERLNPHIALDRPPFIVPTEVTKWPTRGGRRIAGVSSFGLSGTNVHLLVEEGPVRQPAPEDDRRSVSVLALSSRSEAGLAALIARHRERLNSGEKIRVPDYCYSANTGRVHFARRLAVVGGSAEELDGALASALGSLTALVSASADGHQPAVAFLFSGEGSERPGMARALYETAPVFRAALERCDELLRQELEVPLLSVLFPADPADTYLDRPALAQPALFAVEYALAELWRAWGVQPAAILGHGLGEIVAACVAGVMSVEDALRLVAERGRLAQALPRPSALYTPLVEPLLEPLRRVAGEITQTPPRIPFVSTVTGTLWPWQEAPGADHWCSQVQQPVRFRDGVSTLRSLGHTCFVELGPGAGLVDLMEGSGSGQDLLRVPSLRGGQDDWRTILTAVAELYRHGVDVDWAGFDRGYTRSRVPVPNSPFVRARYWIDPAQDWTVSSRSDGDARASRDTSPNPQAGGEDQATSPTGSGPVLTREDLLALPQEERFDVLAGYITRGVEKALGSGGGARRRVRPTHTVKVGLDQPLLDLGIDSLMAMGVKNEVRTQFGVNLPIAAFLRNATVRRLAEQILEHLESAPASVSADEPTSQPDEAASTADPTDALLAELEQLPEEEALKLLEEDR